jgi:predicted nuclease with TOPRIM domain
MSDVSSAGNLGHSDNGGGELAQRRGTQSVNLVGLLEERVGGLVDRYRGAQKGAEELRSRLDAAEAEIGALHARIEEADRLRAALRERVESMIDQVRRLEAAAPAADEEAAG